MADNEDCDTSIACSYESADEVTFVLSQGNLIKKCIRFDRAARANLPFGLRREDSPDVTLRLLEGQFDVPFSMGPMPHEEGTIIDTNMLLNERGAEYNFFIIYEHDGRLREICARGIY